MAKEDCFFDKAFGVLKDNTGLTEQQKDTMLSNILLECCKQETTGIGRLKELVITYPWRFAFTLSTVQALVFTMIFGTQYINLFLSFFGG